MSDDNTNDQGFNEDELQDIMNEIEDLEKEYVEEGSSTTVEASSDDNPHDDLQDTIDKEIEELNKIEIAEPTGETTETTEVVEEPVAETAAEDNVVSIVQDETPASTPSPSSEGTYSGAPVEFSANGDMNLNMNFSVGESTATLMVSKEGGLSVQMDGVNLEITDQGCSVELAGGVKFTVPLTAGAASNNKAA